MANEIEKKQNLLVKVTKKSHVKPKKKLGRKECQLVTFDLPYLAFCYNQKLIFYKGEFNFDDVVGKLKDGLGYVLEEFYPLAGKLIMDDHDHDGDGNDGGVFKIMYDDDMDGVEVVEAIAKNDDVDVCDDDDDGNEMMMGVDDVIDMEDMNMMMGLVPYNGILNFEGLHRPLLAVQLTKLRDGLAIGCAFNHAVLDGASTWHFMRSWAEICNGANSISVQPYHERTKARDTRVKLHLPLINGSSDPNPVPDLEPNLRERVFRFSDSQVSKIKSDVNNLDYENGVVSIKPYTTFQCLSSHIWRAVTRARGLGPVDPTVFTIFMDCRKRVDPPMPETYFGNLIQAVFAGSIAGPVLASEGGGAPLIRAAIEAHDATAINKRNEMWEAKPVIFKYKDAGPNCVAVGSSPRFRVYDVDFGFGRPEIVRTGSNNRFDGMVYLYPGKNGGIDVEISLEEKAMEKLEMDKEFLMEKENLKI